MGANAKKMAVSMINVKPVKASSEVHNNRRIDYDYVRSEYSHRNENWEDSSILSMQKEIEKYCKDVSGRKLQKNSTPIREAVVLLNPDHTMTDLGYLATQLEKEFGIQCFQIHIHRDEGHWHEKKDEPKVWKENLHAHMVFRWQDMKTGKTKRLNKLEMSQMQTLVAKSLGMKRGELKTNSNRERLEPIEFKRKQEELKTELLQEQNKVLEQKKNEVRARIKSLTGEREPIEDTSSKEALRATFFDETYIFSEDSEEFSQLDENDLNQAISIFQREISELEERFKSS